MSLISLCSYRGEFFSDGIVEMHEAHYMYVSNMRRVFTNVTGIGAQCAPFKLKTCAEQ